MRAGNKDGRGRPVLLPTLARWVSPVFAIAIGFYLGAQGPAYSQIESRKISAPPFSGSPSRSSSNTPLVPRAPQQVEMPAPPPIKYFPGLEEPLVATGPVTDEEGKDLDAALKAFHDAPAAAGPGGDYDDYGKPLLAFVTQHPQSNWNSALNLDIGLGYYHSGYYSRAFTYFDKAWQLGRNATSPQARLMVDRAVGELAKMHARVGHDKELEAVLKDLGKRPIGGPATELIQGAREGLWDFRKNPGVAYLCGPRALKNVLIALKAKPKEIEVAEFARSGAHGFSLTELAALADKAQLKYKLIHREPGQPIPVPSVINWNIHHYAAIVGRVDGKYQVLDPTFGSVGGTLLSARAINEEGSGYYLVPAKVLAANPKAGWRIVAKDSDEAKAVYGMGQTTSSTIGCTKPSDSCGGSSFSGQVPNGTPQPPMTTARGYPMVVNLSLTDTPVGYKPQKGVPSTVTLSYNSREAEQPATLGFSNVSPKWTHSWLGFVRDDPANLGTSVTRYASGGGGYDNLGTYNSTTGTWPAEVADNSQLFRTPVTGTASTYQHQLPDGSLENYTLSNGATSFPRLLFLTSVVDPQGNTTTLNYDGTFRLTSIVDAMGRSTTFTYGLTSYPLLITKVTDPFGRTTQLNYDTSQRLSSITDPVGITSTFTYSATETTFVNTLTTPYGTSKFSDTANPNDAAETNTRSLTLTDPLGYTDYYYFYQNAFITPGTDSACIVPTGLSSNDNTYLSWRNTYHWDKHAFALGAVMNSSGIVVSEDFTKAYLTHWYHDQLTFYTASAVASVKPPLEKRVWYNHPNQSVLYNSGTLDRPTDIGRVLDDGTTQLTSATYNPFGLPLTFVDPKGRSTKYTYASNNIDRLTVQQLTAPSTYTTIATYGSYNTQHEPQTYTDAAGQVWHYTWNAAGQIATTTDPNSGVTTYNYDASGRLSNIVNANSVTQVSYTYDSADRIQTYTDSQGYVLTYGYDNIDRVTSITYPDGTTDLYDYTFQSGPYAGTASLELRKQTDRLSRVTTYAYDADERLTSVTEPTSGSGTRTTSYDYYENGKLKDITDANGNVTHWEIDIESRPISKTYAYGTANAQTESYSYEHSTSRLHSVKDALKQVKTFAYGLDDRITGITYTNNANPTPNVTLAYDTYFPRLNSMTDGTGTTNYSYTAIGTNGALKLSSVAGPYSNDTVGLTYDALGRLSGRNITGGNETFGYDAISRLTSHGTPLGSFTEGYLGQTKQLTSQSVTNGSTTVSTGWSYDTNTNDRRLISITNSGVTRSYALGYGTTPVNPYDIMSITDTAATGHPWATQSRAYTYDLIDRLLTGSSTTPGNFTYAYDPLDNSTTVTTPSGTVTPAPTFNGLNQIKTWGSNSYSFDANGNTLSGDGVKTYKWDAEDRLIEVDYVGSTAKSQFTYDGMGRRTVDVETASGGGTTTTRYLWCGSTICQTRNGSDTVLRRDLAEGEYNVTTGQKLVYAPDQLGSVRDVLDGTSGSLVQSYDYTPYGAVARSNGSTPTDLQFARLFYHPQSGLNLATYRGQDGVTGRWINRDPINELGGINLYGYVGARPINWDDTEGLLQRCVSGLDMLGKLGLGPVHHQYQCWTNPDGTLTCRGYGRDPSSSPAKATFGKVKGTVLKDGQNYPDYAVSCGKDDNNSCMDKCAAGEWSNIENNPPDYGWIMGTQCKKVEESVYNYCKAQCHVK